MKTFSLWWVISLCILFFNVQNVFSEGNLPADTSGTKDQSLIKLLEPIQAQDVQKLKKSLEISTDTQNTFHRIIRLNNNELSYDPHFSHPLGADKIFHEKESALQLYQISDSKKPLKVVKAKSSMLANPEPILVIEPTVQTSQAPNFSNSSASNSSLDGPKLLETNIALDNDPKHTHIMGVDVLKEAEVFAEKILEGKSLKDEPSGLFEEKTKSPSAVISSFTLVPIVKVNETRIEDSLPHIVFAKPKPKREPNKTDCVFPFTYKGVKYNECISLDKSDAWCSLTENYDLDQKWKFCSHLVKTFGGTSNGQYCTFPFLYREKLYNSCTNRLHTSGDGSTSWVKFCGTTSNYDDDKEWGYCLDYSQCHFPFLYNGTIHERCISNYLSASFCATTFDFDSDRQWAHCPVVCENLPKRGPSADEFFIEDVKRPCTFKNHTHRFSGEKLFDYVEPPCQLQYDCQDGQVRLFNQIECRIDGSYDKAALCGPTE